jgi:3D (Asp-Asp-Asp) domain-containing protein
MSLLSSAIQLGFLSAARRGCVRGHCATLTQSFDKSPNSSIERARSPRRMVVRSPRVPKTSAPGLFQTELKAAFLRLSACEWLLLPKTRQHRSTAWNTMKLSYTVVFLLSLATTAFAREESVLARVTSYWASEGSKIASTGRRLRPGHCAVDPKRIPYGSKVIFPDAVCTAVDTGTAVVSRKAARLCGRTASQLKAIVVDRFFETKREADEWSNAHSEFMMLRVVPAGSGQN